MSQLRTLLHLAWPIIVSRATQTVVGLCDAIMVAHLGEAALAAVTTGGLNAFSIFIFPMGIVFILSSFSSQLTGRGQAVRARRFGWYGLIIALLSQIVMLALLPGLPVAMSWFEYDPAVETAMNSYLAIRLVSTGAAVGIEALGSYYSGMGNTAILMRTNLVAMTLNVFLNWVLIYGHLGFSPMGVRGAAIASVIATSVACLGFVCAFLWHGRGVVRSRLSWAEFRRVIRFGLPSGLNWSFEFFAFVAFVNVVVAGLGTTSLAALMSVINLNSVAFMPAFGLASAGSILVGQAIGQGRQGDVGRIVWLTFRTAAIWMGLAGLSYLLIPDVLLAPFTGEATTSEFLEISVRMLGLSAAWQLFDAAGMTLSESLRAAGDTAWPMWARGILAWVWFVPGSWIHVNVLGGGDVAVMLWLVAYLALLSLALFWRFRAGTWRSIDLVGPAAGLNATD